MPLDPAYRAWLAGHLPAQWKYETSGECAEQNPEVEIHIVKKIVNGGAAVQNSNVKIGVFDLCFTKECAVEKSAEAIK